MLLKDFRQELFFDITRSTKETPWKSHTGKSLQLIKNSMFSSVLFCPKEILSAKYDIQ